MTETQEISLFMVSPAVFPRELICPDLGVARIIRQLAGWRIRCDLIAQSLFEYYLCYGSIATRYENSYIRRRIDWSPSERRSDVEGAAGCICEKLPIEAPFPLDEKDLAPLLRRSTLRLRVNRFSNGSFVDDLINVIYLSK